MTGDADLSGRTEQEQSGTIRLPDGEEVPIPMPDAVFPRFADIDGASVDVHIEEGRIRMREEDDCHLRLGVADASIGEPRSPATLYAGIEMGEQDTYAEIAFHDMEQVRELRDALTLALRYRGVDGE